MLRVSELLPRLDQQLVRMDAVDSVHHLLQSQLQRNPCNTLVKPSEPFRRNIEALYYEPLNPQPLIHEPRNSVKPITLDNPYRNPPKVRVANKWWPDAETSAERLSTQRRRSRQHGLRERPATLPWDSRTLGLRVQGVGF